MIITEKQLRTIIRNHLIKENKKIIQEGAWEWLTGEKNLFDFKQPGDVCGSKSNPNLTLITISASNRFNNVDHVIVININKGQKLIDEKGNPLVQGGGFSDNFQYVLGGKAGSYKDIPKYKKEIPTRSWLMKNFFQPVKNRAENSDKNENFFGKSDNFSLQKFVLQVQEAMADGRVAVAESSKLANNFEAKTFQYEEISEETLGDMYEDVISWSGTLFFLIELGFPELIPVEAALTTVTSAENLRIKLFKKDYITSAFVLIGLIPNVAKELKSLGKTFANASKVSTEMPILKSIKRIPNFDSDIASLCNSLRKYAIDNEELINFVKSILGEKFDAKSIMPNLKKAIKDIYNFFWLLQDFAKEGTDVALRKVKVAIETLKGNNLNY